MPGFRERIIGAELAEMSEIKAIELEVKQSVDADVKKAKVINSFESCLTGLTLHFYRVMVKLGRRSFTLTFMKRTLVAR